MINLNEDYIMMIEPLTPPTKEPIIDEYTKKLTTMWRNRKDTGYAYRGFHWCHCGVTSDNRDHLLNEMLTNNLCIHYIAYHRDDVPESELKKINKCNCEETIPTEDELKKPIRFSYEKQQQEKIYSKPINKISEEKMSEEIANEQDKKIIEKLKKNAGLI